MHSFTRRRFAQAMGAAALTGPAWAQQANDLEKIRAGGVLKVAVYKDFNPFSYGAAESFKGVDVALAEALAKELGLKLSLLPFDSGENMSDDLRNMVWKGHYLGYGPAHVMLHVPVDRYFMRENKQALIFAPYYRETVVLAHRKKALPKVERVDDLLGHTLAVERGTAAASAMLGALGGQLKDKVHIANTAQEAAESLLDGRVDAVYATRAQIESVIHASNAPGKTDVQITTLTLNGVPAAGWPVGMAVKAEATELSKALEVALVALSSKGSLKAIFEQEGVSLTAV